MLKTFLEKEHDEATQKAIVAFFEDLRRDATLFPKVNKLVKFFEQNDWDVMESMRIMSAAQIIALNYRELKSALIKAMLEEADKENPQ